MGPERLGLPLLAIVMATRFLAAPTVADAWQPDDRAAATPAARRGSEGGLPQVGPDRSDAESGPDGVPGWFYWFAGRFRLHVNGAAQGGSRGMTDRFGYRAYGEDVQLQSVHTIGRTGVMDAGGSVRVWRDLSVGASYGQAATSDATIVSGVVPHPIRHDAFRELPPHALSFNHRPRVTHPFLAWRLPVGERIDASFFAGPSLYNVTQGVVTNVTAREAGGPPFAVVQVDQVQVGEHTRNTVGGHVGVDVTYMPTRHFGVGFLVRYATGSVDLPSAGTGRLVLRVGGVEVGGGIRIRF